MKNLGPKRSLFNTKGSALVSALLVITVLLILGTGVIWLSLANAKQARFTDTFERSYYTADGGAQQAIERIKGAVLDQYNAIASDLEDNILSSNNAASFFSAIDAVNYTPPQPDASTGGPSSLQVDIAASVVDADTHRYTVTSRAYKDGTLIRRVQGSIDVTFVPVTKAATFTPLGNEILLAGGLFDSSAGYVSITGSAKFGSLNYKKWNFNYNGNSNPDAATLQSLIDPALAGRFTWSMKYPGFTKEAKSTTALTLPAIANGTTVTNASFKDPPYNWTVPSPIYLEGQSGASFTISSSIGSFNGGQIVCTGSLTDTAPIIGTSASYVKIYSSGTFTQSNGQLNYVKVFGDGNVNLNNGPEVRNSVICAKGDLTISGRTMSNLKIYCGGNLTISGGSSSNVTIYCNGTFNDNANTRTNMKVYCDSYRMSGGNIVGDSIVYAETFMHLESTVSGLFYTNGDIDINNGGSGITGQIAAKGNITTRGYSFTQDLAMIARLNVDPFVTSSPGSSGSASVTQPQNSQIFTATTGISE